MTTDIAKFDPAAYVDAIKGKIKSAIVDAIPDGQWDALIRAEVDKMFATRVTNEYGATRTQDSEFSRIVGAVFENELKTRLKNMLDSPEWQAQWDGHRLVAGERLAKLLVDNADQIISRWLGMAFQNFLQSMPRGF